ncbi:MAG: protein kinase [Blastocatellia bacterium]|nr:protein kinase [Blastocatellia bacterium]
MPKSQIMIVDSETENFTTFVDGLKDLDCEFTQAENGQEALHLIMQNPPTIIISEWSMPVMDGLNLFLQIKNSPHTSHIPFIFHTTINDIDIRVAMLEAGVEDCWEKPYNVREAKIRISRLLERINPKIEFTRSAQFRLAAEIHDTEPQQVINFRYEIIEEIGEGGMGVVYRAQDYSRDRQVAVKVLKREYVSDETAIRRFARESEAAMRIVHPNVVATYEYGLLPTGQAYIVMELLNGNSLESELFADHRLIPQRVLTIMRQVCLAVSEAHHQGVVHRDLKPNNIYLVNPNSSTPVVKVLDFGIAMLKDIPNQSLRITGPDVAIGTPLYLSPEQAMAKPLDERSDIYSLGVVFYELLSGSTPFTGKNYREVLMAHINEPPTPLEQRVDIDKWFSELVMKMLSKKPQDRIQTIDEVLEILNSNRIINW